MAETPDPVTTPEEQRAQRIAEFNDRLRQTFQGGRIMMTNGVANLEASVRHQVLEAVRRFEDFTPGNDPYQEHDFGAVEVGGSRFSWKIDYLDKDLTYGSEDPADSTITERVMTVMRSDEY